MSHLPTTFCSSELTAWALTSQSLSAHLPSASPRTFLPLHHCPLPGDGRSLSPGKLPWCVVPPKHPPGQAAPRPVQTIPCAGRQSRSAAAPVSTSILETRTPFCQHISMARSTEIPAKPRELLPISQLTWSDGTESSNVQSSEEPWPGGITHG